MIWQMLKYGNNNTIGVIIGTLLQRGPDRSIKTLNEIKSRFVLERFALNGNRLYVERF